VKFGPASRRRMLGFKFSGAVDYRNTFARIGMVSAGYANWTVPMIGEEAQAR
jgi:hypothetical protein